MTLPKINSVRGKHPGTILADYCNNQPGDEWYWAETFGIEQEELVKLFRGERTMTDEDIDKIRSIVGGTRGYWSSLRLVCSLDKPANVHPIDAKRKPGQMALELADTFEELARLCREGKVLGGAYAVVVHDPAVGNTCHFGNLHDEQGTTLIGALQCLVVKMAQA